MTTSHDDLTNTRHWLTYTAAAARYRVSVRTLQRLANAGDVERVRVPHRRPAAYLSVLDLDEVLGDLTSGSAAA